MHTNDEIPTNGRFTIKLQHVPCGILAPSTHDLQWFAQHINSDIRFYYKSMRQSTFINDTAPIGQSGITAGELALYIIRENHTRRRKRY